MKILNDLVDRVMDSLELFSEEDELTEEDLKPSKSEAPKEKKDKLSIFRNKNVEQQEAPAAAEKGSEEAPSERRSRLGFRNPAAKETEPAKMSKKTLTMPIADKLIGVTIFKPINFDDVKKIADCLKNSQPIVVNFEDTDNIVTKRMSDYIAGTIYALGGDTKKVGRNILICAPKNVDIDAGVDLGSDKDMPHAWKK